MILSRQCTIVPPEAKVKYKYRKKYINMTPKPDKTLLFHFSREKIDFFSQLSHKIMEKREMFGCQARRLPTSAQWMCE